MDTNKQQMAETLLLADLPAAPLRSTAQAGGLIGWVSRLIRFHWCLFVV